MASEILWVRLYLDLAGIDNESSLKALSPYRVLNILVFNLPVSIVNPDTVTAQSLPCGSLGMNITKLEAQNRYSVLSMFV